MHKFKWLKQIDFLIAVFKQKGYAVFQYTDAEDSVQLDYAVFINSRKHPEKRFYTLLHELGHVLICENSQHFEQYNPVYARTAEYSDGRKQRRKDYRVSIVSEEIEAWKKGLEFAQDNKLYVDEKKYKKDMTECVFSYISWASDD